MGQRLQAVVGRLDGIEAVEVHQRAGRRHEDAPGEEPSEVEARFFQLPPERFDMMDEAVRG